MLHLRPWLIGQPFRIGLLDAALGRIVHRQGVWAATGAEIIDWYRLARLALTAGLALSCASGAAAQDVFVYPARNQTPEQMTRDKEECHDWAVQQTQHRPGEESQALVRLSWGEGLAQIVRRSSSPNSA